MSVNNTAASAPYKGLTPYPLGSLRELWAIAWPLMLSSLSGNVMVFVDRLILTHYSSDAFNACSSVQPWYWAIQASLITVVCGSNVVMGRLNGAKQYRPIGTIVLQMIILSLCCYVITVPVAFIGRSLLADSIAELGLPYFRILLMEIPFEVAACGALGSFFIAIGKTRIITMVALTANILNSFLAYWFVFGGLGIPSLGIRGAALANSLSNLIAFSIYISLFLRKENRSLYGINTFKWSNSLLIQCLKIGLPNAVTAFIISSGISASYQFFADYLSPEIYKAFCVCFTVFNLSVFIMMGLSGGVGTLCSNLMGAKKNDWFPCILKNACYLTGLLGIAFLIFLLLSDPIVRYFATDSYADNADFRAQMSLYLKWTWPMFLFQVTTYCINAFLFALFKIKEILSVQIVSYVFFIFIPSYVLVKFFNQNSVIFLQLTVLKDVLVLLGFCLWFRRGTWREVQAPIEEGSA